MHACSENLKTAAELLFNCLSSDIESTMTVRGQNKNFKTWTKIRLYKPRFSPQPSTSASIPPSGHWTSCNTSLLQFVGRLCSSEPRLPPVKSLDCKSMFRKKKFAGHLLLAKTNVSNSTPKWKENTSYPSLSSAT